MYIDKISLFYPNSEKENRSIIDKIEKGESLFGNNEINLDQFSGKREYRRMDRFSLLSVAGTQQIVEKIGASFENCRIATVMNTSYGPIRTNIEFVKNLVSKHEDTLSPTLFSHTVNNAALGHICKQFQLKGPSTLLLSSNTLNVSEGILKSGKADAVLVISVEENNRFVEKFNIKCPDIACCILLKNTLDNGEDKCRIIGVKEMNLGGHLYYGDEVDLRRTEDMINKLLSESKAENEKVKYAIISTADNESERIQNEIFKKINNNIRVINLYKAFGETLGVSLNLGLYVATLLFNSQRLKDQSMCLINILDISGNYISALLGR